MEGLSSHFPPGTVSTTPPLGQKFVCAPGEYFVECPYNNSHKALNHRYARHMEKCRRNYRLQKMKMGEPVIYLSCKYNHNHQILAPEIHYHEYSCLDKTIGIVETLFVSKHDELMAHIKGEEEEEKRNGYHKTSPDLEGASLKTGPWLAKLGLSKLDHYDIDKMTERLCEMCNGEPFKTVVEGLLFPDPETAKSMGQTPGFNRNLKPAKSQLDEPVFCKRTRKFRTRKRDPTPFPGKPLHRIDENGCSIHNESQADDTDDEDWSVGNTQSTFSWLENQQRSFPMSRHIPPGLTKSQRKKYVEKNGDILKYEYGVFPDIDESGDTKKLVLPSVVCMNADEAYGFDLTSVKVE